MAEGTPEPSGSAPEAFVMVPVPPDRVRAVYALLATDEVSETMSRSQWSEGDIRELGARVRSPVTKGILAYLADRPDTWISTEELRQALTVEDAALRAALSGFSRTIKAHMRRTDWPMEVRSTRVAGSMVTEYRMVTATAAHVRSYGAHAPSRRRKSDS